MISWSFILEVLQSNELSSNVVPAHSAMCNSCQLSSPGQWHWDRLRIEARGTYLSLYFYFVCQFLSIKLTTVEREKHIQVIKHCRKALAVNHSMFAYDLLIFFKVAQHSCQHLNGIPCNFANISGLEISKRKSVICFNLNYPRNFEKFLG